MDDLREAVGEGTPDRYDRGLGSLGRAHDFIGVIPLSYQGFSAPPSDSLGTDLRMKLQPPGPVSDAEALDRAGVAARQPDSVLGQRSDRIDPVLDREEAGRQRAEQSVTDRFVSTSELGAATLWSAMLCLDRAACDVCQQLPRKSVV